MVAPNKPGPTSQGTEYAPVVTYLDQLLAEAVKLRASDLHFDPFEHSYRVRLRIDGELREMPAPARALKDKLASRIKVLAGGHYIETTAARRPHETAQAPRADAGFACQHALLSADVPWWRGWGRSLGHAIIWSTHRHRRQCGLRLHKAAA